MMAISTRAGDKVLASTLLLPAAMTVVTPDLIRLVMALSKVGETLTPMLKEATAGPPPWLLATQSIPEMISEWKPDPSSPTTLMATALAFLATPLCRS